jgi:hypothetical protein
MILTYRHLGGALGSFFLGFLWAAGLRLKPCLVMTLPFVWGTTRRLALASSFLAHLARLLLIHHHYQAGPLLQNGDVSSIILPHHPAVMTFPVVCRACPRLVLCLMSPCPRLAAFFLGRRVQSVRSVTWVPPAVWPSTTRKELPWGPLGGLPASVTLLTIKVDLVKCNTHLICMPQAHVSSSVSE